MSARPYDSARPEVSTRPYVSARPDWSFRPYVNAPFKCSVDSFSPNLVQKRPVARLGLLQDLL